jgi:hypothetical protein
MAADLALFAEGLSPGAADLALFAEGLSKFALGRFIVRGTWARAGTAGSPSSKAPKA